MTQHTAPSVAASPLPSVLPEDAAKQLHDIVKLGEAVRQNTRATMPRTAPGFFAYCERVSLIRQWLMPLGWKMEQDKNFELCVSPCGKYAITSRVGDISTGKIGQEPRLARTGKLTQKATLANGQLVMFEEWERERQRMHKPPVQRNELAGCKTYILIVHRDAAAKEIRAELSLPVGLDEDGQVGAWEDRNVLAPIPIVDASSGFAEGEALGGDEEQAVDFDVELRGSDEEASSDLNVVEEAAKT